MTRTQVAAHLAGKLASGRKDAVRQAAAWLIDSGRIRQASYLAADVATFKESEGYVLARITSARALPASVLNPVTDYIKSVTGAKETEIITRVDPDLIGGIRIETPTAVQDESVHTKLRNLAEGTSR